MKRVLFVLPDLGGGGAERVFVNIANGFAAKGIEVELLLGKKTGVYFDILDPAIPVHELGTTSFTGYCRKLPSFLKTNIYTHIFTTSDYLNVALISVKKRYKLSPVIILNQQYSSPAYRSLRLLKEDLILSCIHRFFTPGADIIVVASNDGLKWLQRKSKKKLAHAVVIHNPVYDDSIYSKAADKLAPAFNTEGKKILLNIGRLVTQKDQVTLIKAFSLLANRQDFVLIILGAGPEEQALRLMVKNLKLENQIYFAGFDANPYRWISHCDLFVLSSVNEGFGNVIVEAMALGKTVVSTDCPTGPAEILNYGQFGYLSKVKDPEELAKTIVRAVNAPLPAALLIEESRRYKNENIIHQFINILG